MLKGHVSNRVRLLSIGVLALLLGATLFAWRPSSRAVLYSGYARADSGLLTLEVTVDPPVALPGTQMRLTTRVANHSNQPLTPSILLKLPSGLQADVYALPSGATFNLQENRLDWLPLVGAGGVQEFTVNVVAQSTDVLNPERSVEAVLRHQGDERTAAAPIWVGIPPLVGVVEAQGQASVGQPVRLRAGVTGPGPLTVNWDLGDGRRLELAEPEVVFPTAGTHTITVEVANPGGRVRKEISLTVLPHPVASFRPDDDAPAIGQSVTFLNRSGGQPPLRVFWDFGDGSTLMGEQQPSHTYTRPGSYRVRLTVENEFGRSDAVWDVVVGDPPVADMVITERVAVGQPLAGQAFGDDTVQRYTWDMGDGRTRAGQTISHLYRMPGDYYVTLTADNGFGQRQVGRWVRVDPGTTSLFLPMMAREGGVEFAATAAGDVASAIQLNPVEYNLTEAFRLDPVPFDPATSPAEQLLAYINAARARFSLPPMAYSFELSSAAQAHALDKARFPDNPHVGTDGTTAAERLLRGGYRGGYAGEATAWGFADPRMAVEFWINSETHRPLLLNQLGTEVGIGYVEDFATDNVWHWTAEFGISYGAPVQPVLRALLPAGGHSALDSDVTNFNWMWPLPLGSGERFVVYLVDGTRLTPLGSVSQPVYGSRYVLSAEGRAALGAPLLPGSPVREFDWLVRLEDGLGNVLAESERRLVSFAPDPNAPTPTVAPTVPLIVTATSAAPTPTATPTSEPTPEPPPGEPPPPIIVTSTPPPSPTPPASPQP